MISSLLKKVMTEFGLRQVDLAETLGVSIDRVKSLTSGKVKKLTREESQALIKKLDIRGEWLVTGDGEMRQSAEQEFQDRLHALQGISQNISEMDLPPDVQQAIQGVAYAVSIKDVDLLKSSLSNATISEPKVEYKVGAQDFTQDEVELIALYRSAPLATKAAVLNILTGMTTQQSASNKGVGGNLTIRGDGAIGAGNSVVIDGKPKNKG